jgi:uracil-DNA glycosylase family 4
VFTSEDSGKLQRMRRLRDRADACTLCGLSGSRTRAVVGSGSLDASVVLVGEAPGRKEDETGLPFVGSAGKLLDRLLAEAGLSREDVFITNIVKCRPPGNRRPKKTEVESCEPYLDEQLSIIRPRVVAPMGNSPLAYFQGRYGLPRKVVGDVHGEAFTVKESWGEVTLMPLYHPAAAIYNRRLLRGLEEDMRKLARL